MTTVAGLGFFAIVKIGRSKAGLPIVRMDHVGHKPRYEAPADGGGYLSKRGEAKGVIGPVGAARRDIGVSRTVIEVGRIENEKIEMSPPCRSECGRCLRIEAGSTGLPRSSCKAAITAG